MVRGVTSDLQTRKIALIHKRLANVQRNLQLSSRTCVSRSRPIICLPFQRAYLSIFAVIPLLLDDTRVMMESWGTSGSLDPFDKVYEVSGVLRLICQRALIVLVAPCRSSSS